MSPDPNIIGFLESVVYGEKKSFSITCLKAMLIALSMVYRGAIWLYLLPFEIGIRRRHRLSVPVVSVGNLTVGGTGKTPVAQYLCRGFNDRKWLPAVLSYGYGSLLSGKFGIVADRNGVRLTSDIAGDEPAMLASSMPGIPVLVCKDRVRSGRAAIDELDANILLLDDGFQVWKLHRDLDIVLVNANDPFDNGYTLPAGKLRESPKVLKRAHCVIVTGDCKPTGRKDLEAKIHRIAPGMPVFFGSFKPSSVTFLADASKKSIEEIRGKKIFALSSIANPKSFEETLATTGTIVVGKERYPDHHLYSAEDVLRINRHAVESNAEFIATTEKDAVKLKGCHFAVPIVSLRLELELNDEAEFWEFMARKVGETP